MPGRDHPVFGRMTVPVLCLLVSLLAPVAFGETYSYVDDHGTAVFTDDEKKIPERYRSRVRVLERTNRPGTPVTALMGTVDEVGKGMTIAGLTAEQSRIVVGGFTAAVVMFAVMLLTGNSAVRLLMRWLLILLAIGTTALLYSSHDGLTKASLKGQELQRSQQQKATVIDQMEPAGDARP